MTEKKRYSFTMSLLKFIVAIFAGFKDPKAAGATLTMSAALAGGGYALMDTVNAKHNTAMTEISKNRDQVQALLMAQQKVLVKLDTIKEGVDDTKVQVEKTRDRVWQIGRDVYILKSKTN